MMRHRKFSLAMLSGLLVAGCASADPTGEAWSESLAHRAFAPGLSKAFEPETLTSTLPSTTYVGDVGADEYRYSQAVVTGKFTASENGRALNWSADEPEEVSWDSDRAETREIMLSLQVGDVVDELTSSNVDPGDTIPVWITVDGSDDAGEVADGLTGIDHALVFLTRHPDNPYDGGWTVALEGALVGVVDPETGTFDLPVFDAAARMSDAEPSSITRDASTIDELVSAGRTDIEVVIDETGQVAPDPE